VKTHSSQLYIWYRPPAGQNYSMPFMKLMPNGLFCNTLHYYGDEYYGYPNTPTTLQYLRDKISKMSDADNYFVGDGDGNPIPTT